MRPLVLALGLIASTLFGCANLLIHEDDSPADKVGKVGARVLLGFTTLGISELVMADQREAWEREQLLETYCLELARLVDEGGLTKTDAEKFHQIARAEMERRAALHAEQRRWAIGAISASSHLSSQRSDPTASQTSFAPPPSRPEPLGAAAGALQDARPSSNSGSP